MKCENIKELLSAYADNELTDAQRNLVEEHLAGCADCRAILADYTEVRKQLLSLRETPPLPDVEEATMTKIKMVRAPAKLRRWLRPALVGVPIIAILATVLPLYLSGSSLSPTSVIAKAYAATERLTSYRTVSDGYVKMQEADEWVYWWHSEFEYAGPDRYHLMKHTPEAPEGYPSTYFNETIVIGDQRYSRGDLSYPLTLEMVAEHIPTKERTLEQLNLLIDIETMPEETMDGVDCYHYRGTVDLEKWLDWMRPDLERMYEWILKDMIERYPDFDFDHEEMKKTAEYMLVNAYEETYEFWIGKDDYLIRQLKDVMQSLFCLHETGGFYLAVSTSKYYDFNEPIVIEPPLDESGELLEGWVQTILEE